MQQTNVPSVIEELQISYPDLSLVSDLKTGKEADVFIVKSRNTLMALKIYRGNTKFSTRLNYLNTNTFKGRVKKAVVKKTRKGLEMTERIWTANEYNVMEKLYSNGAFVPKPLAMTSNAILMEYIGDELKPAPRLIDMRLNKADAYNLFDKTIYNLEVFSQNNIVHGDLSPYNILVWQSNPIIIDFPQVLYLGNNVNAYHMLKHDIDQLYSYFTQYLDHRVVNELHKFMV